LAWAPEALGPKSSASESGMILCVAMAMRRHGLLATTCERRGGKFLKKTLRWV
jgi:hypothetical protein